MQFNLPLYSRLFYIVGGSDVFLFVFCIGFFQSFVILILGIPRAIIMSGKLFPVKITKITIPSVAFDKPNKQFQLLALHYEMIEMAAYKDSLANRLLRESKEIKSNFGNR